MTGATVSERLAVHLDTCMHLVVLRANETARHLLEPTAKQNHAELPGLAESTWFDTVSVDDVRWPLFGLLYAIEPMKHAFDTDLIALIYAVLEKHPDIPPSSFNALRRLWERL